MASCVSKTLHITTFVACSIPQLVQNLQPKTELNSSIQAVVDKICVQLRQQLKPVKILKGGSYGKGTNLGDRKEVDIVVIFENYEPNEKNCIEKVTLLKQCASKFLNAPPNEKTKTRESDEGRIVEFLRSINFMLDGVKVDLLPGCRLNGPKTFLAMDDKSRPFASASACEYQVKFIKNQDARYKDLVRLCKCWRDLNWGWPEKCTPSSYLIELLCLHVYQSMDQQKYNIETAFRNFLLTVSRSPLKIWWNRFYEVDPNSDMMKKDQRVVLDPANPTNKVAWTNKNWSHFEANANQTLRALESPMSFQFTSQMEELKKEVNTCKQSITELQKEIEELKKENILNMEAANPNGRLEWTIPWGNIKKSNITSFKAQDSLQMVFAVTASLNLPTKNGA